jgi:hypothetical protein
MPMSSRSRLCLLICLLALQMASPARLGAGEERTRTFEAQKCRYTLPGPAWSWLDDQKPENMLCMTRNTNGFVISLSAVATSDGPEKNEQYGKEFEKSLYKSGQFEAGGQFYDPVAVRFVPAYPTRMRLSDGRKALLLVFTSRGFHYHMTLIGGKEKTEVDRELPTMVQGFDFTVPDERSAKQLGSIAGQDTIVRWPRQEQNTPASAAVAGVARIAAIVAFVCIVAASLLLVFRLVFRKPKAAKK